MSDFVPGKLRCAKCGLDLFVTVLNMESGTASASTKTTETCPNGCGPMWRITWE